MTNRLQTNADRARVIEGLATSGQGPDPRELDIVQRLAPRWFALRDVHAGEGVTLLQPRWAMSWMRGPMTRTELRRAIGRGRGSCAGTDVCATNVAALALPAGSA